MLGTQLFTVYINDLDKGRECAIANFADSTKIGGGQVVRMTQGAQFYHRVAPVFGHENLVKLGVR